jgi:Domain of unknown function (DUF4136)
MQKVFIIVFLGICLSGCFRNKVFVEHDYKYSLGFNAYKTYGFVDCERDTGYFCDDVQQAIKSQMSARGYKLAQEKPDLYVNFHIYYDAMKYRGYDQPSINLWLSEQKDDEKYRPLNYSLNKGTLMISLIEFNSSEVVWRGYATGIFNENSKKKSYFKNIVATIFSEYPLFATDKSTKTPKISQGE